MSKNTRLINYVLMDTCVMSKMLVSKNALVTWIEKCTYIILADAQNQSVHPMGKQLETLIFVLYYLFKTYCFHF